MMYCSKCKKVSYGSELCYNCYQENIKKNLVKINPYFNKCIKCSKTINKELYCEQCYKKNIPLKIEQIARDYSSIWRYKTENPSENQKLTEYSNRNCISCYKQAKLGSNYCEEHFKNFMQETLERISIEEISKNDNNLNYSYQNRYDPNNEIITTFRMMKEAMKYFDDLEDFEEEYEEDFDIDFDDDDDDEKLDDDFFDKNQLKKYNIRVSNPKYAQASYQKNRIYLCKNGNKVRSKSERTISDFLTDHKVPHAYEKALKYNDGTIKYLHPDFYIPSIVTYTGRVIKDIYIEHLGGPKSKNSEAKEKYNNSTKYKMAIYKRLKLTVLCTTEEDMINPEETLKRKLINIKEHKINY